MKARNKHRMFRDANYTCKVCGTVAKFNKHGKPEIDELGRVRCVGNQLNHLTVDHIIPRVMGGLTHPANLMVLCSRCNVQKGSLDPNEWLESLYSNVRSAIRFEVIKAEICHYVWFSPGATPPTNVPANARIPNV